METKQLLTFKTAAENLNFTKTAKILKFAQSSVTAQIKALEKELDTPLFERLGKRLYLTESGRQFKKYADQMLALTEEAQMMTRGLEEPTGTLVIGAQESQCTYRLPPILRAFKEQFPQVKLVFKPVHSNEKAKEQLLDGTLDIAFIMDVLKPIPFLTIDTLVEDPLKLVVSMDHPFPANSVVNPNDLEGETLLLTETGCSYRTILENTLNNAEIFPANKFEFLSVEAIKQCVIADLGVAILPEMVVEKDIKEDRMKALIWTASTSSLYTQIAWHKDKFMTAPLEAFVSLTKKTLITT
ncbi:LysR family transcriptional regulator [Halobacillus litoralis]|uniref:LysR family transcriptional regulator n=1 Tax=Halobacillus litoralis TaxID=45668 RepID=A0A410M9L2_9BACI|nr:LysR family transcriptional regulator [Halobacillus litoralis]QAS51424.1 LysR family transcriptional regulator [Halobacillus litoralis]